MQDTFRGTSTTKTSADVLYQQGRDYCAKYKLSIAHLVIYCEIVLSRSLQKLTGEFKVGIKFSKCDLCGPQHVNGLDIHLRRISIRVSFHTQIRTYTLYCVNEYNTFYSVTHLPCLNKKYFPCMSLHIRNTEEKSPNMTLVSEFTYDVPFSRKSKSTGDSCNIGTKFGLI